MTGSTIFHALGLHMHQPPGNLRLLIEANPGEAEQIIRCYERPVRYAERYPDTAHLHIGFSGVLLDQLLDPDIVDRYRHILDIPEMLDRYARAQNIELIGMGHYHPIFPLIPQADWPEQLARARAAMLRAFGRAPRGFWPPEMAFTMDMIPALVQAGYDYLVVDGVHVRPEDGITDVFRPYRVCHEGVCITVVPRDREVSMAQETGLDVSWFQNDVRWRVGGSARPHESRLVTTWSDGENGAWVRQPHEGAGFFGYFFAPYMEQVRGGAYPIMPVSLNAYLADNPPAALAQVQTGAWNVGSTSGYDRSQWAGSERQRAAATAVSDLSARYWDLRERLPAQCVSPALERVRTLILEAQTSCFLFWGEAWLPHLYARTGPAAAQLNEVEAALTVAAAPVPPPGGVAPPPGALPAPAAAVATPAAIPQTEPGPGVSPLAASVGR
ncbi:glycoside hydrolase family 57 [uncultured Thiodictyon sp.]|uniref:glycoside hydrolase family 57 n=1 Tax=uncultured Thiodictyon sp. TaxID=1846217 RepID=UPI0025FEE2EB|nr:glycoside hydrolase family 57 [uncultured Thiodictyon sp.]